MAAITVDNNPPITVAVAPIITLDVLLDSDTITSFRLFTAVKLFFSESYCSAVLIIIHSVLPNALLGALLPMFAVILLPTIIFIKGLVDKSTSF